MTSLRTPTNNDDTHTNNIHDEYLTPVRDNENSSSSSQTSSARPTSHKLHLDRIQKDCAKGKPTIHRVYGLAEDDESTSYATTAAGDPEGWMKRHHHALKKSIQQKSCFDLLECLLPMFSWLKVYQWKENLITDVIAGLTVGVMIIPQSMSYAKLAGLPVEFGLYSSLVPIYAYAFFGSSRQLAVGPVALVSLILNNGLTLLMRNNGMERPDEGRENYEQAYDAYMATYSKLAIQTSFLVGCMYILMGVLKLGFITIFLSHAVISGFTSAAAILIGLSQIKYVLGYDIPSDKSLHKILYNIFRNIGNFNYKTFLLGMSCLGTLLGMKFLAKKYDTHPVWKWSRAAAPLVVTVSTILLALGIDFEAEGIKTIQEIPSGFPKFTGGLAVDIQNFGDLAILVISIVVVGFMESIAIAKQLASKHNYEIDSSKELIGLGMANLSAGLFGGYPITGSFSRSAVNNEAGAKSGISSIVTATLVALVLLFMTPVFELLSLPTLASIVISGVISLVDYEEAIYLWRVHKFDFGVWNFAFLGTLFLGVELGLLISVGLSLFLVIFESAYPHTAILGRLPGTTEYRNIKNYRQAERYDGVVVVRVDAPIYFANTQSVREKVQKYVNKEIASLEYRKKPDPTVHFVIIELSACSHVDTSALHILKDMIKIYKHRDIQLCFSNPNGTVMQRFIQSGLVTQLGEGYIFVSTHDAMDYCLAAMHTEEVNKWSQHQQREEVITKAAANVVKVRSEREIFPLLSMEMSQHDLGLTLGLGLEQASPKNNAEVGLMLEDEESGLNGHAKTT